MKRLLAAALIFGLISSAGVAMAAGTNTLTVSANVVGTCMFSSPTSTLAFGPLDPALTTDAAGTGTTNFWCTKNATYTVSDDLGLYKSGAQRRMQHATIPTEYVPYSMTYTTTGIGAGKTTPITLTLSGTVVNADYVNAAAGNYADTVIITVTP